MRKAQAAALDIFIALSIFIFLIIIIIYFWNDYNTRLSEDIEYERMQIISYQITNQLIKTQGIPVSWEKDPSNFQELGLATSDRVLSTKKVDEFVKLPYDDIRDSLNLEGYDCSFNITTLSNKNLKSVGGSSEKTESVGLERYVVYDDEKAIFKLQIWKKQ